ncbi:hypothetical protein Dimus_004383 [Dionaea muscipula]
MEVSEVCPVALRPEDGVRVVHKRVKKGCYGSRYYGAVREDDVMPSDMYCIDVGKSLELSLMSVRVSGDDVHCDHVRSYFVLVCDYKQREDVFLVVAGHADGEMPSMFVKRDCHVSLEFGYDESRCFYIELESDSKKLRYCDSHSLLISTSCLQIRVEQYTVYKLDY